jgi:hypothetical protein
MLIVVPATRLDIIEELIDTGNILDALTVGLFQQGYTPSINSTFAELEAVKANFTNYAVFTPVVWTGPYLDANKTAYALGGLIEFLAGPPTPPAEFVPNVIGGYYLYTGTTLKCVEEFTDATTGLPTPVPVSSEFGIVPVIPRFSFGQ